MKNLFFRAVILLVCSILFGEVKAQPYFIPPTNGLSGSVLSLGVYNNQLYAGGGFNCCGHVARWNGTSWDTLMHNGLTDFVGRTATIKEFNGKLYLGGYYTSKKTGLPQGHIMNWDGVGFEIEKYGFQDEVNAVTVYNGKLIAAGNFINLASGYKVNHIAELDGGWRSMDGGVGGDVHSLVELNGDLYAAGWFNFVGQTLIDANNIGKYDGISWGPVGDSSFVLGEVYSLAIYDGVLHAGGSNGVFKWNGNSWLKVGGTFSGGLGDVYCMTVYGNELYVGGNFVNAGSSACFNIARWNGTSWRPISTGINTSGFVNAMQVYNGKLFVGGKFNKAGSYNVDNIVIVKDPAVGIEAKNSANFSIYPNPSMNGSLNIIINSDVESSEVNFFNLLGENLTSKIKYEKNGNMIVCKGIPMGHYVLELSNQYGVERRKVIVLE